MTISEYTNKLSGIIQRLDSELEAQAAKAGRDIIGLVTNRVVQKGQSADGPQFTPYSENQIPAHFYFGKSRTGSAEAKVKAKAKKGEKISYRDFRVINGLNAAPKNFEFTGDMWRKFGVVQISATSTGVRVTIGGTTTDATDKIASNSRREKKSIIKPSKSEIAIVQANLTKWAQNIVNG